MIVLTGHSTLVGIADSKGSYVIPANYTCSSLWKIMGFAWFHSAEMYEHWFLLPKIIKKSYFSRQHAPFYDEYD